MTAGHCLCTGIEDDVLKPASIKVTMSQHDLTHKNTDAYQMDVKTITIHPGYICTRPKDDIALLELQNTIHWSESVLPACLPVAASQRDSENILATVAGWGWTNEDSSKGGRAKNLQKARVNIIETNQCRTWYHSQGKKTKIHDSHICAGYEQGGIDACWADSGGPLMVNTNQQTNQMMVVGVVSTGIGCARPYLPGLYTRVSDYIPWIREVIGN
nr:trypsin-1 [Leptinotarsa decemlineata]